MEEILHHLGCKKLVNNGRNCQPQLVQDFFHQQYHDSLTSVIIPNETSFCLALWLMVLSSQYLFRYLQRKLGFSSEKYRSNTWKSRSTFFFQFKREVRMFFVFWRSVLKDLTKFFQVSNNSTTFQQSV